MTYLRFHEEGGQIFSGHECFHKGGQTMFSYFFIWPKLIFLVKRGGQLEWKNRHEYGDGKIDTR